MYTLKAVQITRSGMQGATVEVNGDDPRDLIRQFEESAQRNGYQIAEYLEASGPTGDILKGDRVVGSWNVALADELVGV